MTTPKKLCIEEICWQIANCPPSETKRLLEVAKDQCNYLHPLKLATQIKQNNLWEHNMKVINQFLLLKAILKEKI